MREMRNECRILVRNAKERDKIGDQKVERRMLLTYVFVKDYLRIWTVLGQVVVPNIYEHDNQHLVLISIGNILRAACLSASEQGHSSIQLME
jgi:hypothetical protein